MNPRFSHLVNLKYYKHPEEGIELISDQNKAKRMLDLIDSSSRSHQGEGYSGFIDPIDPTHIFSQSAQIKTKTVQ
jgi:hypothetical protein